MQCLCVLALCSSGCWSLFPACLLLSVSTAVSTAPLVVWLPRRKMEGPRGRVAVMFLLAICHSELLLPAPALQQQVGVWLPTGTGSSANKQLQSPRLHFLHSVWPYMPQTLTCTAHSHDLLSSPVLLGSHPLSYQNGSHFILTLNPFQYGAKLSRLSTGTTPISSWYGSPGTFLICIQQPCLVLLVLTKLSLVALPTKRALHIPVQGSRKRKTDRQMTKAGICSELVQSFGFSPLLLSFYWDLHGFSYHFVL